jgi:hypothetical protein
MDYDFPKSRFYQAMMTGLFVGFVSTLICLIYNIIFRSSTRFDLSDIINVSSLIFIINLVFVIIGIIYYALLQSFKKADLIYIILFVLLTLFFVWRTELVHRTDDPLLNTEFRNLLLGIVLILGVSSIFVPILFRSSKFREEVL